MLSGGAKVDLSRLGPADGWTWESLAADAVVEVAAVSALKGDVAAFTSFVARHA